MKKVTKFLAAVFALCMLLSAITFAEEQPVNSMAYGEWLAERGDIVSDSVEEGELEPVGANEKEKLQACSEENIETAGNLSLADGAITTDTYQAFEGSFASAEDVATYNFSVDFSQIDSVAVCLVRKGYVGADISVYDEGENRVLYKGTSYRQAKSWAYIDKPSDDAGICNYTIVVEPSSYEDRASDYRIIVGDKKNTELLMSGIENTVLLEQYYEEKINLQNNPYLPNIGEYWYKYERNSNSVITILSSATDIRFKVLDVNTLKCEYDSADDLNSHKTRFVGTGSWICAEKARLTGLYEPEYYLVVYCANPDESLFLRSGSMATAVGNPVMGRNTTTISPEVSVTATASGYSSAKTFSVTADTIPNTAQVDTVTLYGTTATKLIKWRLKAPNRPSWTLQKANYRMDIDFDFVKDSTHNAYLKGTWSASFQAKDSNYSFTPRYYVAYYYEYGD